MTARCVSLALVLGAVSLVAPGCGTASAPAESPASGAQTAPGAPGLVTGNVAGSGPGAIVVLTPADGHHIPPPSTPAVLDQSGYEFFPRLLVAQAGQTVVFHNSEDVLHNVRVTEVATDTSVFNVATVAFGSYDHKFDRAGFYSVTCDIHTTMRADIFIAPTPYTARTEEDGRFTIQGVPPGEYIMTFYAGGMPVTKDVEVKSGGTELNLP